MNATQLATRIRSLTKTTVATLPDADLLPLVNSSKDEIASKITEKSENFFIIPAIQNIVANQREYPLPDDVLNNLSSVEFAFDTATPIPYITGLPYGYQQFLKTIGGLTEENIVANFDNTQPYYFIRRRAIYLLSGTVPSITNGMRINYRAFPADLASLTGSVDLGIDPTTTTFGMPRQFHELWARRVSIEWKGSRPKPLPLSPLEQKYDVDLMKQIDALIIEDLGGEDLGFFPQTSREGDHGANL